MNKRKVVEVEKVSKCYEIYNRPRDRLKQLIFPQVRRYLKRNQKKYYNEYWALKEITFNVKAGETVSIIGRNGSGKSTLLQMISGTLNPTEGFIKRDGRLAAVLELGSGFNPELTGKENVLLNGLLLGLSREQVESKFEKIKEFAGIGEFIYQPVKIYSTGMYVRLAFAIQSNLDADMLVVDEALSVGDGEFQLKCTNRLKLMKEKGKTIILVSHDMNLVSNFSDRVLIIEDGYLIEEPSIYESIKTYEKILKLTKKKQLDHYEKNIKERWNIKGMDSISTLGNKEAVIEKIIIENNMKEEKILFEPGEKAVLKLIIRSERKIEDTIIGFGIRDKNGMRVIGGNNLYNNQKITLQEGLNQIEVEYRMNIVPGEYFLNVGLVDDREKRIDLDQNWGEKKIAIVDSILHVGIAYSSVEFKVKYYDNDRS